MIATSSRIHNGLLMAVFGGLVAFPSASDPGSLNQYCPIFYKGEPPANCLRIPDTFVDFSLEHHDNQTVPDTKILEDAFRALVSLQKEYFDTDYGTWPESIDWTAAVAGTVMTGMLTTLSRALGYIDLGGLDDWKERENLISSFYAQIVSSYFSQDILSIRGEVR
jgi:hypothetical protein